MTSWSTDGDLFANGGVGRSAEAPGEVDGGIGFRKTAVGGIRSDEIREPRRCKPAQTATTATSSTVNAISGHIVAVAWKLGWGRVMSLDSWASTMSITWAPSSIQL